MANHPIRPEVVVELVARHGWGELAAKLAERADYRCEYCDQFFLDSKDHYSFDVDHIKPENAGGLDEFENYAAACPTCNRHIKGHWFDPTKVVGENSTRDQRIQAARDYVRQTRAEFEKRLTAVRALVVR